MSIKMSSKKRTISTTFALSGLLVLSIGTMPAGANQRPDQPRAQVIDNAPCSLERVGTQYVKCDLLTGSGVPAPEWIPSR
jgi:hypothetical protein